MWIEEITKATHQLNRYLPPSAKTALDIGSEGEEYRNVRQPWNKDFYDYFKKRNIRLFTMDMEPRTRPDFVHDITQPVSEFERYDLVIATHLLEHIPLSLFNVAIENIESLVKEKGYLLVSVPHKYPYHERPIDNMWRPTWKELRGAFNGKFLYGETFEVAHTQPQYMHDPKCQISTVLLKY